MLEFNNSGVLAAISSADEMLSAIQKHTSLRPFSMGGGDQNRYFGPSKNCIVVW